MAPLMKETTKASNTPQRFSPENVMPKCYPKLLITSQSRADILAKLATKAEPGWHRGRILKVPERGHRNIL